MFQNKCKSSAKDVKIQRDRNAKKDVELCLEVEMDDEVREIITSPEKSPSTLLDVTVIKPKDLDHLYCTQRATLSGEEVRKLIASMELEKQDKQKLINKILSAEDAHASRCKQTTDLKSSGDYEKRKFVRKNSTLPRTNKGFYRRDHDPVMLADHLQKFSTTDDTNSDMISYRRKSSRKNDEQVQQIYTTSKAYNDIRSIFTCKNRMNYDQNEKPDRPCLCRNCAIVGVLTDSQKKPFITENLYDPRELLSNNRRDAKESRRKKSVNFKEEDHLDCDGYFRYLSAKIRKLEERLVVQEEKSVPRDYFKRIITKLVAHLSKIASYSGYDNFYNRKGKDFKEVNKTKDKYVNNKYCVHPLLVDSKIGGNNNLDESGDFMASINDCMDKDQQTTENFWKWGEEILRPGIDLKNKIIMLLEDTLQNLRKTKNTKMDDVGKIFNDNFETPQKLPNEVPVRDTPNIKVNRLCKSCGTNVEHSNSGSTLSKSKNYKSLEKKTRKVVQGKPDMFYAEAMDVSYVNPKSTKWTEESQISFKLESSDIDSLKQAEERRINQSYKAEFKETLLNTKDADKLKLWQSVWNQAKMNGQSKDDKVTIQIPHRKNVKTHKMVEIEYTIAELEELLVGNRHSHKNNMRRRN